MQHTETISHIQQGSLAHVLRTFTISLLVSFLGTLVGAMFIPRSLVMMFVVIEVVMLIAAFVMRMRGKTISYTFLYVFTAVTGVTLFPVIETYGGLLGAKVVSGAFLATTVIFGGLALYAARSKRDFSFLGGFLMAATLGLIVMGLVSIFVSFGSATVLVWSMVGILIFSGWVLYDISQYRQGIHAEEVPMAALNLYLNFINLFIYILRLLAAIFSGRD
ncbi:Bax inhibitor-1/YccA family protein [Paenibacillus sp. KN14-4R]|uniref:Bax inhibitor-1/YccA family protein n=1 Tax=Paenibacillus sp. KN14-4R TaxID=3445773 RepID=UPI003F9FD7B1